MECVHIKRIATPLDLMTIGRHDETRKVSNWPRGCMIAGNPLRIHKGHGTGVHRNMEFCMNDVLGRVR